MTFFLVAGRVRVRQTKCMQRPICAICLPMAPGFRSLNLVTALSMVLGEALRQTDGFPHVGRLMARA